MEYGFPIFEEKRKLLDKNQSSIEFLIIRSTKQIV